MMKSDSEACHRWSVQLSQRSGMTALGESPTELVCDVISALRVWRICDSSCYLTQTPIMKGMPSFKAYQILTGEKCKRWLVIPIFLRSVEMQKCSQHCNCWLHKNVRKKKKKGKGMCLSVCVCVCSREREKEAWPKKRILLLYRVKRKSRAEVHSIFFFNVLIINVVLVYADYHHCITACDIQSTDSTLSSHSVWRTGEIGWLQATIMLRRTAVIYSHVKTWTNDKIS